MRHSADNGVPPSASLSALAVIWLGCTSMFAQTAALRRLLVTFSGNEQVVGTTFAIWLSMVGFGALLFHKLRPARSFEFSLLIVALLLQPTLLFIELIRPVFGLLVGETASLSVLIIASLLSLSPLCLALGAQFPLSVRQLRGNASHAYGLEAAGACVGGVIYTVYFAGKVDDVLLAAVTSSLSLALAVLISRRAVYVLLLLAPLLMYVGMERIRENAPESDTRFVRTIETASAQTSIHDDPGQSTVFISGRYAFTYPDVPREEVSAHLSMTLHAAPRSVLVIGGSPAVVRELLKYPLISIDYVGSDEQLASAFRTILSVQDRRYLLDQRVHFQERSAFELLRVPPKRYDLIMLNQPPKHAGIQDRMYTRTFFTFAKNALEQGGIFCIIVPPATGGESNVPTVYSRIHEDLDASFSFVAAASEENQYYFASMVAFDKTAGTLRERFEKRGISTESFHLQSFPSLSVEPKRTSRAKDRQSLLSDFSERFHDMQYFPLYGEAVQSSPGRLPSPFFFFITAAFLLFIGIALLPSGRRLPGCGSIFTCGFTTMGFSIVIMLAYQARFDTLYGQVGLLSGAFMAGSVVGTSFSYFLNNKLHWIAPMELVSVGLLCVMAPLATTEMHYFAMLCICGFMAGGPLYVSARTRGTTTGSMPGTLYSFELFGALFGALLTTVALLPYLGITTTLIFLAAIKLASLISSIRNHRRVSAIAG